MNQNLQQDIHARYEMVLERIEKAAASAGRCPDSIRLVVVTKTHPIETVIAALEAGIHDFGENYPEEAVKKISSIGPVDGLTWHMIGHIQSRKAEIIAQKFDYVHSLDSLKLANRLERYAANFERILPVLLECNISGEASKYGFMARDRLEWGALAKEAETIAALPHLKICGVMTMPPLSDDLAKTRKYFSLLRDLKDYLSSRVENCDWKELSMGTSTDFSEAIAEGATMIRVGTAIMGPRPEKA